MKHYKESDKIWTRNKAKKMCVYGVYTEFCETLTMLGF